MQPILSDWEDAGNAPALGPDDVHVWRTELTRPAARTREMRALLAPDELTRADRFHFDKDRDSFTMARGTLRLLLGRYLGCAPEAVQFVYGEHGKPALAAPYDAGLSFNVSHSGGLALYAMTRDLPVGVDVEHIRPDLADEKIAERFFAPSEVARLLAIPDDGDRLRAFFACWTRKEAYIKAVGMGLALSLQKFEVSLAPGEAAALLTTSDDPDEAGRWTLAAIDAGDFYAAAVAVRGIRLRIRLFHMSNS